jgi:hypothetical protein
MFCLGLAWFGADDPFKINIEGYFETETREGPEKNQIHIAYNVSSGNELR